LKQQDLTKFFQSNLYNKMKPYFIAAVVHQTIEKIV